MYSVVRENFYDSEKLSRADKEMKEFQSIHAVQLGYRGNIFVDLGGGAHVDRYPVGVRVDRPRCPGSARTGRRPSLPGAASLNQGYTVPHLSVGHTSNVVA
jgi:hypothetical protein